MAISIKGILYRTLSIENYLRILQRSYFFLYRTGFLKRNPIYKYHYYVKNLIQPGDTIIDIGANLGYYSMLFSKWTGPYGRVYAVEPVSLYNKIFKELSRNRTNITLYPYALGPENKKITIVDPLTGSQNDPYLKTGLLHVYDKEKDGELSAHKYRFESEMRKPESLFAELKKIDYIKCDVEGFELEVLTQMKSLILKHKPIVQSEIAGENRGAIKDMFTELGYSAFCLEGNELKLQTGPLPIHETDFIFKPDR